MINNYYYSRKQIFQLINSHLQTLLTKKIKTIYQYKDKPLLFLTNWAF